MSNKFEFFLKYVGHYKYPLIILIGLLMVGLFSESSTLRLLQLTNERNDLQDEVKTLQKQNDAAKIELEALKRSSNTVEKVARERYFMKKDNEDVFVLSTDMPAEEELKKAEEVNNEQ